MLNLWHAYIRAAQVGWDANVVVAMRLMRLTVGGALAQRFRSPTMLASPVAAAQTSIVVPSFMAIAQAPTSAGGRGRTCVTPVSSGRRSSAIPYQASPSRLCATLNRRYHSSGAADASNVMILLPSVLQPHRFPCVLPLAALVTTVFLTVPTGALAQGRYRSAGEAVAAL